MRVTKRKVKIREFVGPFPDLICGLPEILGSELGLLLVFFIVRSRQAYE